MACRLGLLQKQTILLCKRMQVVHIIGPEKGNFGAFLLSLVVLQKRSFSTESCQQSTIVYSILPNMLNIGNKKV